MVPSTEFKLFGTLTHPQNIVDFYSWMQKRLSRISIALGCFGQFAIYARPEIILFLILIVTGHRLSWKREWDGQFLQSREEVTNGETLDMVAYGIGILHLKKIMKAVFPDVTQPWCADNAGALGTFKNVELYFNLLKRLVLGHSYYP